MDRESDAAGDSVWTVGARAQWTRLVAHRFEDRAAALDFTRRLARDHGWSLRFAREAVEEYRRWCFLAARASTLLTPSPVVDEVWHLHLTYTADYWQRWCPLALGTELHHQPTAGGPAEQARYAAAYTETLAQYWRYFGTPAPAFWPPLDQRFRRPQRFRWIDADRHLVLARPRQLLRRLASVGALLALPVAIASAAAALNPLDWNGPAFLGLYGLLLVLVIAVAIPLARRLARPEGTEGSEYGLSDYEIAYLFGGRGRAFDAVVAGLLAQGAVAVERGQLVPRDGGGAAPTGLPALLLQRLGAGRDPAVLLGNLKDELEALRVPLVRRGLMLDAGQRNRLGQVSSLAPAALLLFGVAKLVVGLSRGKPVGYLLLLCLVTAVIGLLARVWLKDQRTRGGQRLVALLRERHRGGRAAPGRLPLAVALLGLAAFGTAGYADYRRLRASSSSSGDSNSSSGSDSGSSDGGGGGDSGGSGCGGCGGGGGD